LVGWLVASLQPHLTHPDPSVRRVGLVPHVGLSLPLDLLELGSGQDLAGVSALEELGPRQQLLALRLGDGLSLRDRSYLVDDLAPPE
jgi:hypothetical protein